MQCVQYGMAFDPKIEGRAGDRLVRHGKQIVRSDGQEIGPVKRTIDRK